MKFNIPKEVTRVTETLKNKGFEAYLIGGCVRDLLLDKKPKDWDVTTNAKPEQIQALFDETFYENEYGTVGVVNPEPVDQTLKVVEVTPYRLESKYSDKRHPESVSFSENLLEDLKRRDFTINTIAIDPYKGQIIDPYKGQNDLKDKIIRAVGKADNRFDEDALRIMRAVRIAVELGFVIEDETGRAITKHATGLNQIAIERIRDELSKIILSKNPMDGIIMLHQYGILKYIIPELEVGIGVEQNGDHIYDVWEHSIRALKHAGDNDWMLHVKLAALFHDIAKPETRRWSDEKKDWTFYGHDVVGGKVAKKILTGLKYSNEIIGTVEKLVRWHLFFSDVDKITLSAVRRLVRNVGPENVWDLMKVRACDRIGMGRPKEKPYRLRKYEAMIEEASRSPVSVTMLKINGAKIMEVTRETPGPRIGFILHALLEETFEDPDKNQSEHLEKKALQLSKLSDLELKKLGESGKQKKEAEEGKEIAEIRKRHWVE